MGASGAKFGEESAPFPPFGTETCHVVRTTHAVEPVSTGIRRTDKTLDITFDGYLSAACR